jgi:NAD(P)-dependent dehydrogenase (short-subunit alcohol dehydrogenase family)
MIGGARNVDLQGRTGIVTGANAGLGFETALQLTRRGARVILACRSGQRAEAAVQKIRAVVPGADLEIATVDVGDLTSVRSFAATCMRRFSQLDFLCNNAGIIAAPYSRSPQGLELHMATNYFGPFALVGLLLDLLRASSHGRIVNISSQIHRLAKLPMQDLNWEDRHYRPFGAYAQSKLALTCFTLELHRRLQREGSHVMALLAHPGFSITDVPPTGWFSRVAGTRLKPLIARSGLVQSAAEGARSSLYALTSLDVRGGDYIGPDNWLGSSGAPARARPSACATDPAVAAALWERSSRLTGISPL